MPKLPARPPFKVTLGIAAAVLLAGTAGAIAAGGMGHGGPRGPMLRALDTNDDGRIERAEFDAPHKAALAEADANGNGMLELAEAETYMAARKRMRREAYFKRLDSDGDGSLSEAEMRKISDRRFSRLDADGDGELTVGDIGGRRKHRRHMRR